MGDAVIVIDMVNDFVTGAIGTERAEPIVSTLAENLLPAAHEAEIPVIYVNDAHLPTDFELEIWGKHAMRGTEGAEVVPELKPEPEDTVLEKRFYDAFYHTGLDAHLRALGVTDVVLTGLHTDMCVRHTAASALFNGYGISVPTDCVNAFSESDHQGGLEYLERVYNATLLTSDDLLEKWGADVGPRRET